MITWFMFGAFVGMVFGMVISALFNMSSKDLEADNLLAYVTELEDELAEEKKINQSLMDGDEKNA